MCKGIIPPLSAIARREVQLMFAPAVLDYGGMAATSDRIVGPIAASVAAMAASEVLRALRWGNLFLGAWLVLAPVTLDFPARAWVNSSVAGVALALTALVRGRMKYHFAGGWIALFRRARVD